MATTKPRLTITLEPGTYATLKRLGGVQGRSVGAIVREVLESVEVPLGRVADVLEALEQRRGEALDGGKLAMQLLSNDVNSMERDVSSIMDDFLSQLDIFAGNGDDGDGDGAGAARGVTDDVEPPCTNRGVRSGDADKPKRRKAPARKGSKQ